jgi:hypothetical protein
MARQALCPSKGHSVLLIRMSWPKRILPAIQMMSCRLCRLVEENRVMGTLVLITLTVLMIDVSLVILVDWLVTNCCTTTWSWQMYNLDVCGWLVCWCFAQMVGVVSFAGRWKVLLNARLFTWTFWLLYLLFINWLTRLQRILVCLFSIYWLKRAFVIGCQWSTKPFREKLTN